MLSLINYYLTDSQIFAAQINDNKNNCGNKLTIFSSNEKIPSSIENVVRSKFLIISELLKRLEFK